MTSQARPPRVSISLVTWNGMHWLPACLDSVAAQTVADYELLIFDNASTDGSQAWLRQRAAEDARIQLRESERNLGYAAAHNRTIDAAAGAVVVMLNQDVVLDPGFLAATTAALDAHPDVGSVQGQLRRLGRDGEPTDTLDTTGLLMHRDRRVVNRDQLRTAADVTRPAGPVWGVDGPAPVYRRATLADARLPRRGGGWEVCDEDFVDQKVDVDLAWRLRRLGWECWYEPAAIAWHGRTGGDTGQAGIRGDLAANMRNPIRTRTSAWRNQRLAQLKNDELVAVLRDLLWIVRREAQQLVFMLAADRRRLRAIPELMRRAPMALRKRQVLGRRSRRNRATR